MCVEGPLQGFRGNHIFCALVVQLECVMKMMLKEGSWARMECRCLGKNDVRERDHGAFGR